LKILDDYYTFKIQDVHVCILGCLFLYIVIFIVFQSCFPKILKAVAVQYVTLIKGYPDQHSQICNLKFGNLVLALIGGGFGDVHFLKCAICMCIFDVHFCGGS